MKLITFSGLDGAGKTTQVRLAARYLVEKDQRVRIVETAKLTGLGLSTLWVRTKQRLAMRRSRVDASAPDQTSPPVETTSPLSNVAPNPGSRAVVKGWLMYPLDCLVLTARLHLLSMVGVTAVVCDRYVYDKIANLPDPSGRLARWMLRLVPRPDVAILLDVPAETACVRRPETRRHDAAARGETYHALARAVPVLTIVPATTPDETQRHVERLLDAALCSGTPVPTAG